MADLTGITLGKYRLTERLGRGGMAEVYKAYHPRLDRYVAIKVLHSFLAGGEGFLERFEREARAVASLRHPNIVLVHDFDVENDTFYMVMEYVEGLTLKDRIQELLAQGEYMPLEEVISLFQQISSALDYAHSQGLIHRDIKPSNILLDKNQQAYLTDFGIAHIVSDSQFTVTGTLVGTPVYMSPEQGKGEKVTSVSDIYSLGIILYQLLTGKVPYDADTPLAVIHKHVNEPLPMPRSLNPSLSARFESVILKSLAKHPADRFEQASDLARALEAAAEDREAPALDLMGAEARPTMISGPGEDNAGTIGMEEGETDGSEFRTAPMEPDNLPTQVEEAEDANLPVTEIMDQAAAGRGDAVYAGSSPVEQPAAQKPAEQPKKPQEPAPAGKKPKLIPILVAAGVLVVIIILAVSGVFSGGGSDAVQCGSVEDCVWMARESEKSDPALAVAYTDRAISISDQGPGSAFIWCERGEFLLAMGDEGPAVDSFSVCFERTGDDPALEDMRLFAREMIAQIEGR